MLNRGEREKAEVGAEGKDLQINNRGGLEKERLAQRQSISEWED